ncbi:putative ribonuclease H-like domain-containing protein [Tanacetum coccineum]
MVGGWCGICVLFCSGGRRKDGGGVDIEKLKKDKESNQIKIDKFENASKSLDKLIGGQISDNNRKGVGYNSVPPPPAGLFSPPTIDLSSSGLKEFQQPEFEGYGVNVNKSVSENSSNENKRNTGAPIIEDWVSDCDEDECEEMIYDNVQHKSEPKPKQAKHPRKINENPRNSRTNWNEKKTQKLGVGFQFTKKACFVCGSFNHLIKDCDFHDKKMVQKPVINNVQNGTGQREVRPVWNNALRTNHQNFSNSMRNFAPTAVLTMSGIVPISTARQRSSKASAPLSAARPINTAAPKLFVNAAKTKPNVFQKAHSLSRRPFNQQTSLNNRSLNNKINNAKINSVNTAKGKRVTSVVGKQGINVVKSSTCWVWRPKRNIADHISKNSGSYICKRFDYGDPQVALKDTWIFDSGCSRYMTGNKSFLTYYQDYNEGFVAFADSSKGGRITGKGKIKTGKLDFEDVYFVKELKFNLFSVSQMCDKKNSVLFTETECLILSPDFKLPDENQVMLKIPRKDNMYSFDLKNVVPSKGLTCLIAKATNDESNMWHRRLGHINFKTMNKLVKGNLVRGLPLKIFENDHSCVACQKGKQHKASCKSKLVTSVSQPLQILHMDLFGPTFVKSIMGKAYCLVVTDDYSRFSWVFFLAKKDETSGILKNFITGIENQLNHKVKIIRCDNGTEFKNYDMNQFCGIKGIKREFSNARTPQQNGVAERKNRTLIEAARTMLADSLLPIPFWAEAVNTACYVQNRVLVTKPHNKTPYELLIGRTPIISFMRPFGCPVTILNTLDHLGKFDGKADEGFLVGQAGKENVPDQEYILLPLLHTSSNVPLNSEKDESSPKDDAGKKNEVKDSAKEGNMNGQGEATNTDNTNRLNTVSSPLNTVSSLVNTVSSSFTNVDPGRAKEQRNEYESVFDPLPIPDLEDTADLQDIFGSAYDDEYMEPKKVFRNKRDQRGIVVRSKARLVAQGYRQEGGVDYDEVFAPIARIEAIRLFLAFASFMGFTVYQMDVKSTFLYGTIEEETLSTYLLEDGFRRGTIDKILFIKKIKNDILLVQVYVDAIIFGSTKESLSTKFEQLMHKRFQMSSMGELTFFLGLQVEQRKDGIFLSQDKYVYDILKKFGFSSVKTTSTPMETHKPLSQDTAGTYVDVYLYRSMIGSLMYLTSSRPDIMFAVCACSRFQVQPKASHMHVVKRIFRYLKGQPTLGLWYPKDSPMDLISYSDSDYAGASIGRKSTTGEYIAASNCCGQVLWLQNQLLDYGYNFMKTKIHVDNESAICVVKNPVYHSKTKHIEIRHHFIRDSYEKNLIEMVKIHTDYNVADLFTKAFDVTRISKSDCLLSSEVGDEVVHKELGDRMERAATTASSLEAEQDSGSGPRATKGYSGEDIPLFTSMITAPETSPSRITSSPSLSPQHTPFTTPSTSQPSNIHTTPVTEEVASMPYEPPLPPPKCSRITLDVNRSWHTTKQTYGTALTKLIKKVKKLDQTVKTSQSRRRTKVVLSDEEEVSEDPSKQGRSLIEELDLDAKISLVPPNDVEIQKKIREHEVTTADTALNTASVPISTASATPEVSTAAANLVYIRRSAEKRKDKEAVAEVDIAHVIDWNDPSVIRYHALQKDYPLTKGLASLLCECRG